MHPTQQREAPMPVIHDDEFGKITIRRSPRSTQVRLRVAPDGSLRASLPMYAPLFLVKRLIKNSRQQLRELQKHSHQSNYEDGMSIGKSHSLIVKSSAKYKVSKEGRQIVVNLPESMSLSDLHVSNDIREIVGQVLRVEAKSYLPRRLSYLAMQYGFKYSKVRFSHASGRWGSCSAEGTISLNIALMKLPFELIDYVLIHELSHTKELNHSTAFWAEVSRADPSYKKHRALLKNESPSL